MTEAPLFIDPIYGAATDPAIIWNRQEKSWWILYTQRRNSPGRTGVSDVHGTKIGVASSKDGSRWLYRGTLEGLDFEPGHNTFWAPEILFARGEYHMYVSYITGIPTDWDWPRTIIHYTSDDLWHWKLQGPLPLSSGRVIDACVIEITPGTWKMWYKDEDHESHSYAAISTDLYHWEVLGDEISYNHHEGPNAFRFEGKNWMITDEWDGLGVYETEDFTRFERNGVILKEGGHRPKDDTKGHHADVIVCKENAYIIYFTHEGPEKTFLQAGRLQVKDGKLVCDRDETFELKLIPPEE